MNAKGRTRQQPPKTPMKREKVLKDKVDMQSSKFIAAAKTMKNAAVSSRERKLALKQDVEKLKKKLRLEENIRRALERAFTRPLGNLPRLPPDLPPVILALLAEVAVLEEEIVRLEEQVVHFRRALYREAAYTSSSKMNFENIADSYFPDTVKSTKLEQLDFKPQTSENSTTSIVRDQPHKSEDRKVKDNQVSADSSRHGKELSNQKTRTVRSPAKGKPKEHKSAKKHLESQKLQMELKLREPENAEVRPSLPLGERLHCDDSPNKISEGIIKCLSSILLRMSSMKRQGAAESSLSLLKVASQKCSDKTEIWDPYGICSKFGMRDIGPYKHLCSVEAKSIKPHRTSSSFFLIRRLKLLLGRLASVNLEGLTHQAKLAFWINVYNSCMMNAFLEQGIPETPEMVVELMQKATIYVGGHLLNAITIEHFILRLPYHAEYTFPKGAKSKEMVVGRNFGLELSEPLVTFALSCGSWSSPAVRVYTASQVENQLEEAKKEYLQAAIGISAKEFAIPKLLDWYLLDFAKDFDSLLDWICLQLPSELGKEAIKCLETGKTVPKSQFVQVMPYDSRFRYLLPSQ